jgi:hypothetical protein
MCCLPGLSLSGASFIERTNGVASFINGSMIALVGIMDKSVLMQAIIIFSKGIVRFPRVP